MTPTISDDDEKKPSDIEKLLTLDEVAAAVRRSRRAVEKDAARGDLKVVRVGRRAVRVRRADYEAYLKARVAKS